MPPAVNQSNAKHCRHTNSVTDYKEFPERSHYTVGQDGWEEVADDAHNIARWAYSASQKGRTAVAFSCSVDVENRA
jgi:hypothetical protein